MSEFELKTRFIQKHDIEANWNATEGFIPKIAEIIVYDIDELHDKVRIKIGDGVTDVKELPFFGGEAIDSVQPDWDQTDETAPNFIKNKPDEFDALALVSEMELVAPVVDEANIIYTNENEEVLIV